MVKKLIFLVIIISVLSITSCWNDPIWNNDAKKSEKLLEEIILNINTKDKDSLKKLFSKQALSEAEDLDGRMDYLFDFVDGEIISWKELVAGASSSSNNKGVRTKNLRSWYNIYTENTEYIIFFRECSIDDLHPENVGLFMVQVIKAEDKDEQFAGNVKNTRYANTAGIYEPEE